MLGIVLKEAIFQYQVEISQSNIVQAANIADLSHSPCGLV